MAGRNALAILVGTRKGAFVLVHLDAPSKSVVRQRTRRFNPDRYFFDDCPLCQMAKQGGVIVYDAPIVPEDDG